MTHMADRSSRKTTCTRIAIVDDHPMILRGLGDLIADQPDMEVCCQAGTADEAWQHIQSGCPDVVVLDLMLQKRNALHLLKRIKDELSPIKVIILTLHPEDVYGIRAFRAGADGFVNKENSSDVILNAIRVVARGEQFFSEAVLQAASQEDTDTQDSAQPWSGVPLTDREIEIFELIGNGFSTKQIAQTLSISPKTVETHQTNLREKLSVSNGRELSRKAMLWLNSQS